MNVIFCIKQPFYAKHLLVILAMVINISLYSQFSDDFADGNLNENPEWLGDVDNFIVNDQEMLQLMDTDGGESFIYTMTSFPDSIRWKMDFELDFSPSGSNQLSIYLGIDQLDLSVATGYYLEVGESGSEDALNFYSLENGSSSLLASASMASLANDPAYASFTLEKSIDNNWVLAIAYEVGPPQQIEFDIDTGSNLLPTNGIFGMLCKYTSSRAENFYFDNISLQAILPDTDAPNLLNAQITIDDKIELFFDEALEETTATDINNYNLSPVGNPDNIIWDSATPSSVLLCYTGGLDDGVLYSLSLSGISDPLGNIIGDIAGIELRKIGFAEPGDLLINEVLFDPISGLQDYVEIINASSKFISTDSLYISNDDKGDRDQIDYELILDPGQIVAFTTDVQGTIDQYLTPPEAYILENPLPAFNIANGNVSIERTSNGINISIDSMDYVEEQHDPSLDDSKGVSLERHSVEYASNIIINWQSALANFNYGTPGYINSHATDKPKLLSAKISDLGKAVLVFDEPLDFLNATDANNFTLSQRGNPSAVDFDTEQPNEVILCYNPSLDLTQTFLMSVEGVSDTHGNEIEPITALDLLYVIKPSIGDLIVSEVLADPAVGGSDFIEVQNVSNSSLQIDSLLIINYDNGRSNLISSNFILKPSAYLAISEDIAFLEDQYMPPLEANLIENDIPDLNIAEGNVSLAILNNGDTIVVDSFNYTEDLHFDLLDNTKGISLERLSPDLETNDLSNWNSAVEQVRFATPGYRNSQSIGNITAGSESIGLESKIFSPNEDGDNDLLLFKFNLAKTGFLANIKIFDSSGYFVRDLAQNQIISNEGILTWNGLNNNSEKLGVGMYVISYELFHPEGDVINGKLVCVLADHL